MCRLFVQTQTYDIPCDPRQPAEWLLMQAKKIQRANNLKRANQSEHSHNDELEVLYNRTTRSGTTRKAYASESWQAYDDSKRPSPMPPYTTQCTDVVCFPCL